MEGVAVAIDGGGTGSRLVAVDPRLRVVARREGPPLNYTALGPRGFEENLRSLARGLPRPLAVAASLAGASPHRDEIGGIIARVLGAGRAAVMTDMEAALHGATCGGDGVVVAAGTGSFAYGRRGPREARVGGWGYFLGDEGSAYWAGREAVRILLEGLEEGRPGPLAEAVAGALGCSDVPGCLAAAYRLGPRGVAGLAPLVCRLASGGGEAFLVLARGAGLLAEAAVRVVRVLEAGWRPVVYGTGGFLEGCGLYASLLAAALGRAGLGFSLVVEAPLRGALAAALVEAGLGGCADAGNIISGLYG